MMKLLSLCLVLFAVKGLTGLTCYSCGYEQVDGGPKVNITEGLTPFCDDFAGADQQKDCTEREDCCVALREYSFVERDEKNITLTVGRHGCQKELNEHMGGFTLQCIQGKEGQTCERYENGGLINHGDETIFKAETCICSKDLCNKEDPLIPEPGNAAVKLTSQGIILIVVAALFRCL